MFRLTAKFDIQLPDSSLLVNFDLSEEIYFKTKVNGFDVELNLNPDSKIWNGLHSYSGERSVQEPLFSMSRLQIFVTRIEDLAPPSVETINGITSYQGRNHYFDEIKKAYQDVAVEVLNRVILFFKYRLHNPQLQTLRQYGKAFQNPTWIDEAGQEIKTTGTIAVAQPLPKPGSFSIKYLSSDDEKGLIQAMEESVQPALYEELLSDAQTAVFQGNLRRAILEMAIACEVIIKQSFFAEDTIAGTAFEYLERKQKVEVTATELISVVAKEAFGQSFKEFDQGVYQHIDYLFRCRNKVAHRGKAFFYDEKGKKIEVDRTMIEEWWESVRRLIIWLEGHSISK